MNLIEKAARRLEELQRSGATLTEGNVSTAEAGAPVRGASIQGAGSAAPTVPPSLFYERTPSHLAAGDPQARRSLQRVDLDVARLASQNFVTPAHPHSAIAHEFWSIKRPLLRNIAGTDGVRIANSKCIAVTSALPGEGKTFVATNLAISIVMEYDRKVLLVDGDVVHPSLPGVLGFKSTSGLLDLLSRNDLPIEDVLLESNIDGLTILPAGLPDARATELLASARMADLLRQLTRKFPDHVIIFDSPPLLPTTEAPVLAGLVGQVVMVVGADSTPRKAVLHALALIEECAVVLMLLNKSKKPMAGAHYGYYADELPQ